MKRAPSIAATRIAGTELAYTAHTRMGIMVTLPAAATRLLRRIRGLVMRSHLACLLAAALIPFPAAFRGCDYPGPGAINIPDSPGTCPDFANLALGRLFVMALP